MATEPLATRWPLVATEATLKPSEQPSTRLDSDSLLLTGIIYSLLHNVLSGIKGAK